MVVAVVTTIAASVAVVALAFAFLRALFLVACCEGVWILNCLFEKLSFRRHLLFGLLRLLRFLLLSLSLLFQVADAAAVVMVVVFAVVIVTAGTASAVVVTVVADGGIQVLDVAVAQLLLLLCFWAAYVKDTCTYASRDMYLDIYIYIYIYVYLVTNTFRHAKPSQNCPPEVQNSDGMDRGGASIKIEPRGLHSDAQISQDGPKIAPRRPATRTPTMAQGAPR